MGEVLTPHTQTENIFFDFTTKVTYGQKQHHLVGSVLFDIYDDHPKNKSRLAVNTAK